MRAGGDSRRAKLEATPGLVNTADHAEKTTARSQDYLNMGRDRVCGIFFISGIVVKGLLNN